MDKSINYYMSLPYTIEMQRDPEAGWFVRVKELRGCLSQGDTPEEAIEMIQEAMELWLEASLEDNLPIPEPRSDEDYSGKFVVRVPRSLHRELVEEAERQGVSLNQYINVALARSVGRLTPRLQRTHMASAPMAVHDERVPYPASPLGTEQRDEPPADRPDADQRGQREEP
ncbi:MAG TPA: type II toxin-antitoxin system HicB family antitoxin [Chloroflexi bacterium]|nr:type II toxin-antitoxin system HicB family antitoxin [Chloroflexota bacterium]